MAAMLRQTRDGHLVWVQPTDSATLGATSPAPSGAMPPGPQPDDPGTAAITAAQHGAQTRTMTPAPAPQPHYEGGGWNIFTGSPVPTGQQFGQGVSDFFHGLLGQHRVTPPTPVAPTPHLSLGTGPTISPEDSQVLDTIRGLTTQDYGGTVDGSQFTLPPAPTYTADPGATYADEHAQSRDKTMQGYLQDQIASIKDSDPRQQGLVSRLGEFISALASSGDLRQAGSIMSGLRQRDIATGRDLRDQMFRTNIAGLESGDQAATAHAGALSSGHQAEEHTAEAGYGRGVTQTQIQAGVAESNARAGAETARARAAAAQVLAQMTAAAQDRARAERSQGLGILAQNPQYTDQAATAIAGDMSQGHTGMVGPMAQAIEARQYHNGLAGMVRSLAGQPTNSPMYTSVMQALQRIFPAMNAQMLQGASQNPEGFAEFILQQPTAMQVIQSDPALRRAVLGYAAAQPAPAQ